MAPRKSSLYARKMRERVKETGKVPKDKASNKPNTSNNVLTTRQGNHHIPRNRTRNEDPDSAAAIARMSAEEIEETRVQLIKILKPSSVEYLQNKRAGSNLEEEIKDDTEEDDGTEPELDSAELTPPVNPQDVQRGKWLHMGVLEGDKLKWTQDVLNKYIKPNQITNARFNFRGQVLSYENESLNDQGLHHHGEEPERPGYTVNELYMLARSSFMPQRVFALNCLAALLEDDHMISPSLETPLLKTLVENGIYLLFRFALDDNAKPVYMAALRAMAALFHRPLDIHYLHHMSGIFGDLKMPSMEVAMYDTVSSNDLCTMRDDQLINTDLIMGAVRTNILGRLRYIMDDLEFDIDGYIMVIQILTRMALHSYDTVMAIVKTTGLLDFIMTINPSIDTPKKALIAKVMFLVRILARYEDVAHDLVRRYNLVTYGLDQLSKSELKTASATQQLYLMCTLLYYKIGADVVQDFVQVIYSLLERYQSSFTQGDDAVHMFGNALLSSSVYLMQDYPDSMRVLEQYLELLCCRVIANFSDVDVWTRDLVKLVSNAVYEICVLHCVNPADKNIRELMKPLLEKRARVISPLRKASYMMNVTDLSKEPKSFPSLRVSLELLENTANETLLVQSMVKYCCKFDLTVDLSELWGYVDGLLAVPNLDRVARCWLSRFEIAFMFDLVVLYAKKSETDPRRLLRLAYTFVRLVHSEDKSALHVFFQQVIFNAHWYHSFCVDDELALSALPNMPELCQFYLNELNVPTSGSTSLDTGTLDTCNALEPDWLYYPIVRIGSHECTNTDRLKWVVHWLYVLECAAAASVSLGLSLSSRFCFTCCVFMCNDLFHDLGHLLRPILGKMLNQKEQISFEGDSPGVRTFKEFYQDIVAQYSSSSYGNVTFALYMLVPVQQKYDLRYRKFLWMEYSRTIRFIRVTPEDLLIPIECYLEPFETDLPLVVAYLSLLASEEVREVWSPLMYRIALHHVNAYMNSKEAGSYIIRKRVELLRNTKVQSSIMNYKPAGVK